MPGSQNSNGVMEHQPILLGMASVNQVIEQVERASALGGMARLRPMATGYHPLDE